MKTIKIRVPNKSYNTEHEVLDAVSAVLTKMEKDLDVHIHTGQGGDLDDWKESDLGKEKGLLMVFKVSLKGKEAIKEATQLYRRALKDYNRFIKAEKEGNVAGGYTYLLAKMELDKAKSLLKQA